MLLFAQYGKGEIMKSTKNKKRAKRGRFSQSFIVQLSVRYFIDDIGTRSAALTYYLIFSLFPLMILISILVGSLNIQIEPMFEAMHNVLPQSVLDLLSGYIHYVEETPSTVMFTFAMFFSIYFPWRVVHEIMNTIRIAYELPPVPNRFKQLLKELVATVVIPLSLVISLILIVFGPNLILKLLSFLPEGLITISYSHLNIWEYARFAIAGLMLVFALVVVYELALDRHQPLRAILPGILTMLIVWLASSALFSFYVENFASYSVIYGTLGTFIILLLWLYLTSVIFLMGGEVNAIVLKRRRRRALYHDSAIIHDKSEVYEWPKHESLRYPDDREKFQ